MDAGGIYAQESMPITKQDDVGTMFEKLSLLGRKLLLETLPNILNGQNQSLKTSQKPLFRQTSHVNKKRSIGIKLQKKSTTKYAGCVLGRLHSRPMKVHAGNYYRLKYWQKVQTKHQARSSEKTKNLWIACGKQTVLAINELQPAGKGKQAVHDFLNGSGQQVQIGQQVK